MNCVDSVDVMDKGSPFSRKLTNLGYVGLAEQSAHLAKNLLERRQNRHLVCQPRVPKGAQAGLFSRQQLLQAFTGFFAECQLLANCRNNVLQMYFLVVCEIPQIVEIAWLISSRISKAIGK
jgi:hypothetical protein